MVKIEGDKEFLAHTSAIVREAINETKKAIRKSAEEHVSIARTLSPDKSGELDRSIDILPGDNELQLKVIVNAEHGKHVEFGTRKMGAQAYFRPAYRLVRKKGQARIKRVFKKAMKTLR